MNLYLKPFSYISSAFGKIELIWNDFIEKKLKHRKNETCEPIHSIIMDNDWRDRKELYEYYVNYDALSDTVKIFTNMCEEFFQYVESKKKLYEHFKEPCLSKDTNMCPKFYDECKKYDPENVLSNHSCHEYIMKERAAAAPSVLQRVNTPSDSDPNSDDRDGRMMTYDAPKLSGNPHTVTKLGNVLLGVVATSMTSGALYRFTPLGGMIRNGLGWNTNNMRNFNGGDIRLYDYATESFNPHTGGGEEHYIGYHPA
ncbi:hypothetical protein PVBG_03691 [Plasmodium vivax Brazil I]|uniref:Vir protein n=1 Tax=Plasmodium vivax (strain Brazil I) TaxID=1033975 RepID=A0A0J9T2U6_PLAV1|nr:hypothetical protein PVBG_03691 [Plasmodium vivax Brazil I]